MSVRDELRECGGVPLGDGFSQDSFRTHNVIEGANIANGYCAGVALDWIRRVLQPRNRLGVAHTGTTHLDYGRHSRWKGAVYCRRQNLNSQPTGEWKAMGYTIFQKRQLIGRQGQDSHSLEDTSTRV